MAPRKVVKAKVDEEIKVDVMKVDVDTEEVTVDTEDTTDDTEIEGSTDEEVGNLENFLNGNESTLTVDTSVVPDSSKIPEAPENKNVRIKMRVDHRCNVGGELYDLKKGSCYNVPESVKKILNKVEVLAPL